MIFDIRQYHTLHFSCIYLNLHSLVGGRSRDILRIALLALRLLESNILVNTNTSVSTNIAQVWALVGI